MNDALAVNAVDLTKTFGPLTAVDHISLQVAPGEVYGVLGPNGAGKTTLLRMLFGLIRPDTGTLELFGRSWPRDGVRTLDGVAGFIESPKFYPGPSGRRNLQLLAGLDGLDRRTAAERVDEVLDTVDLLGRSPAPSARLARSPPAGRPSVSSSATWRCAAATSPS
ncbi:MAG: hypothetical protein AUI14_14970 [Actinobacteria bacterium 13_2_20CM_2_71_6]|nr:MAG: hypothetical protein AUI14_14970 [Actinobacteria bacterium 13_2_20CM_2_71_6]